ncbi:MAG: InlB B-repeat-containing protein, partial [Bacilli bacterium]|nr:InlB B-repeat-containing protein [Bacilli bacterium]
GKSINFASRELKNIYEEAILDFDVTNKSRQYGVDARIECTKVDEANPYNEYISIDIEPEEFELGINETMSGKLTTTMIRSFIGTEESDTAEIEIRCTINASALEVDTKDDDTYVPEPTYKNTISGYLVDESNNILANKNLVITSGNETFFVTTDKNGYYEVSNLPDGDYDIYIVEDKTMDEIKNMTIDEIKNQASIKGTYSTDDNELSFDSGVKTSKNEPKEITFDTTDLDANIPPIKVVEGEAYGTLPSPNKPGYTFEGWYLGDELILPSTIVDLKDGQTLTPRFTLSTYTVTINAGTGGTVTPTSLSFNYGNTKNVTVTPSTGYYLSSFSCTNGYTTNAKVGASQTSAQTVTISNNNKEIGSTCTASFTPVNYTLTYNYNGGSGSNPTSYNITSNAITLNNPTRVGHTFTGWTGSNGGTAQTLVTIPKGSTGNKSYTANWSVNSYNVTITVANLDSNFSVPNKNLSLSYGGTATTNITENMKPVSGPMCAQTTGTPLCTFNVSCTNGYTGAVAWVERYVLGVTIYNNNKDSNSVCTITVSKYQN